MADAIQSTSLLSGDQSNLNPATEAPKAKPTTPPKGIPFLRRIDHKLTVESIEMSVKEAIGASMVADQMKADEIFLETEDVQRRNEIVTEMGAKAFAAGLAKARELTNELTRQTAQQPTHPFYAASDFMIKVCHEVGISQIRDAKILNRGRVVDYEPFHRSVERIALIIKELRGPKPAFEFLDMAEDIRHGKDNRRLLTEQQRKDITKSLI